LPEDAESVAAALEAGGLRTELSDSSLNLIVDG
jgi:hypothetical protein